MVSVLEARSSPMLENSVKNQKSKWKSSFVRGLDFKLAFYGFYIEFGVFLPKNISWATTFAYEPFRPAVKCFWFWVRWSKHTTRKTKSGVPNDWILQPLEVLKPINSEATSIRLWKFKKFYWRRNCSTDGVWKQIGRSCVDLQNFFCCNLITRNVETRNCISVFSFEVTSFEYTR